MAEEVSGMSVKRRPLISVDSNRLHLDEENPRLPKDSQGKTEDETLKILLDDFGLNELAESLARNGYFDEEPLVVVPLELPKEFRGKKHRELKSDVKFLEYINRKDVHFKVIEGNRRLATVKLLLDNEKRKKLNVNNWPQITKEVIADLSILPVIVYSRREDVIPYLGVRHIIGIKKWEPYAKATYIVSLHDDFDMDLEQIRERVGDSSKGTIRSYISYRLVETAEDNGINTEKAKEYFSYLLLAIPSPWVRDYIGLSEDASKLNEKTKIPQDKIANLKNFFSFIFGEGTEVLPVIKESRDISNKLIPVLGNKASTKSLLLNRDLDGAFIMSGGEERALLKYLSNAQSNLQNAVGIAYRHKTKEVKSAIKDCVGIIEKLKKDVGYAAGKDENDDGPD